MEARMRGYQTWRACKRSLTLRFPRPIWYRNDCMPHGATRCWEAESDCVPRSSTAPAKHCRSPRISWTPPAAVVELIHSYLLVHDDLPAMDDDDLRCGQPTTHRAFDEATAILAGDALQVLAFSLLSRDRTPGVSSDARLKMIEILADASGTAGMAGGQAIDLAAVGRRR